MNVKVLKSLSGVGHVSGNRACLLYPACRATVRDTPTARCVLQKRYADNVHAVDNSKYRPYHNSCTGVYHYGLERLLHMDNGVPPMTIESVPPVAP
jgi:hypothetical protein